MLIIEIKVKLSLRDHLLCGWYRFISVPVRKIGLLFILATAGLYYATHDNVPTGLSIVVLLIIALFCAEWLIRPAQYIRWWISNVLFIIVVVVPVTGLVVAMGVYVLNSPALGVILGIFILVGLPMFELWSIRESLRKNPSVLKPGTVSIFPEGLLIESDLGETRLNWVLFDSLDEDFNSFYLRQNGRIKIILPKREFSDCAAIDEGRKLLSSYVRGAHKKQFGFLRGRL